MSHLPLLLLLVPVVATLVGGLVAMRAARFQEVLFAAGGGLLLGAAFLDLLPEGLELGAAAGMRARNLLGLTLLFFLLFTLIETALDGWLLERTGSRKIGAGLLIFHSFRDGMAIGAAYSASHSAGYAVAAGIAAHDFGDGMNTVLITTGGAQARRVDYWFLAADAVAPFLGGLTTVWWVVSSRSAAVLLALAAGFFLQMATSDFLPIVRGGRRVQGLAWVFGGAGFIWVANWLVGVR